MDKDMLVSALLDACPSEHVLLDEPLAKHTTFRVGGPVDAFVSPADVDELRAALACARAANAPWHVLGCGSNVLVSDAGLPGLCVHFGSAFSRIEVRESTVHAQAGATNEAVAEAACAAGLAGYEFASGIPGSIGGAAIMNAGAYDGEFKDVCGRVTCLTLEGDVVEVGAQEADWGYRRSMMARRGWTVLDAELELVAFPRERIRARIDELTQRRSARQPLEYGSAGSTFKRPVGHYTGQLVQEAGMQGHRVGDAQVSEKHAGFVVNLGAASAADIVQVISDVQDAVFADSGVLLEPEVRMWGFDDDKTRC